MAAINNNFRKPEFKDLGVISKVLTLGPKIPLYPILGIITTLLQNPEQ